MIFSHFGDNPLSAPVIEKYVQHFSVSYCVTQMVGLIPWAVFANLELNQHFSGLERLLVINLLYYLQNSSNVKVNYSLCSMCSYFSLMFDIFQVMREEIC